MPIARHVRHRLGLAPHVEPVGATEPSERQTGSNRHFHECLSGRRKLRRFHMTGTERADEPVVRSGQCDLRSILDHEISRIRRQIIPQKVNRH